MEAPIREAYEGHECICVIISGELRDSCAQWVRNPDQAFCDECEYAGHPALMKESGT